MAPVLAGRWQQHETWDGTYSMIDLLEIHEAMAVQRENERRSREAEEAKGAN